MTARYPHVPDDGRCPTCGDIDWRCVALQTSGYQIHTAHECNACTTRVLDTNGVIQ